MFRTSRNAFTGLLLSAALLVTAGCGGGGGVGYYEPLGSVEVANLTAFEDVTYFSLTPAGSFGGSGDLLGFPLFPGEAAYVGDFYEDYYDVDYELDYGFMYWEPDYFVAAGFINTFDVF
ncbi:MAG: hypothetical protein QNJ98_16930 [Planctomycetota bacterium]|nr:hypothetical protein [Planctomycetota bacterium]